MRHCVRAGTGPEESGRMRKFIEADEELSSHFTSSIGVRAQSYEPISTRSFDPGEAHVAMRERAYRRRLEQYAAVEATIAATATEARHQLELTYVPFGTGFTPRAAKQRKGVEEETPDFLAIALRPAWGHGSFVRLALTQKRVLSAFLRRHPGKPTDPAAVLDFLSFEAGKGREADPFFRGVREVCEVVRASALQVYDCLRLNRIDAEKASARVAAAAKTKLLDEELGRKQRRESQRFEARLRGDS